jgi:hypothetical protein
MGLNDTTDPLTSASPRDVVRRQAVHCISSW